MTQAQTIETKVPRKKKTEAERMALYRARVDDVRSRYAREKFPEFAALSRAINTLEKIAEPDARVLIEKSLGDLRISQAAWLDEIITYEEALNLKDGEQAGQKRVDALPPMTTETPDEPDVEDEARIEGAVAGL